jgi:hypothetical protein
MRGLIFLLADSQSSNPARAAGSPRARRRRRRGGGGGAGRAKGAVTTAPDRVPGCGGGQGRPLLPARGRTVARGVLQHAGRQSGPLAKFGRRGAFGRSKSLLRCANKQGSQVEGEEGERPPASSAQLPLPSPCLIDGRRRRGRRRGGRRAPRRRQRAGGVTFSYAQ